MNKKHGIVKRSLTMGLTALSLALAAAGCAVEAGDEGAEPVVEGLPLQSVAPEDAFMAEGNRGMGEKACGIDRADHATVNSDIVWLGWGDFGKWADCISWCPAGSYAYAAQLVSERSQGNNGDDTALNAIRLYCYDRWTGTYTGMVTSAAMPWGDPGTSVGSAWVTDPIVGGRAKFQPNAGTAIDDAQTTVAKFRLKGGSWLEPSPSDVQWGSWLAEDTKCQAGSAVCGIKTMFEPKQYSGDDTALGGAVLYCCSFP